MKRSHTRANVPLSLTLSPLARREGMNGQASGVGAPTPYREAMKAVIEFLR
jgi:hypothetical protein